MFAQNRRRHVVLGQSVTFLCAENGGPLPHLELLDRDIVMLGAGVKELGANKFLLCIVKCKYSKLSY